MAVRFLKSFGVTTTVISTSPGKREEALKVLGADNFIVSKDPEQMKVRESLRCRTQQPHPPSYQPHRSSLSGTGELARQGPPITGWPVTTSAEAVT
jgi:D-arabinose 1-dehydrogenase-like Zn-dependent alcohol dehydrogenase